MRDKQKASDAMKQENNKAKVQVELEYKKAIQYLKSLEEQEKRRRKQGLGKTFIEEFFPELMSIPLGWLILGIGCVIFSLSTLVI